MARQPWILVSAAALALIATACRGKSESKVASTPAPTSTPVARTGGSSSTSTQANCFQGLNTYRFSGKAQFKLPSQLGGGTNNNGDVALEGTAVSPDRTALKVTTGSQTNEVVQIGGDIWTKEGGSWRKSDGQGGGFVLRPADFCTVTPSTLDQAGLRGSKEKINGVDTLKYSLGKDEISKLGPIGGQNLAGVAVLFDRLNMTVWFTEKEKWPARFTLVAEQSGTDVIAINVDFNISGWNDSGIKIEAPK